MRMTLWRKQLNYLDWNDAWTSTSAALMVWDAFACMQVLSFLCEIGALAAKCWDKYQLFSGAPFSLCFGPVIVTVTCVLHEVYLEAISGSSGTILNLDDAAF